MTPTTPPSSQTRGFLFADLRGYSAFTERRGDEAARQLLRRYRRLVREQIAQHGGAEIRTEGDSFYVVFASVRQAVLAGLAISEASSAASVETPSEPIKVGIGIHAGETVDDADDGIVSSAVNIAARVCAVAQPGEVLVTDTVRSLTRTAMPVTFTRRGRRRLKGIAEPVTLYLAKPGVERASDGRLASWRMLVVTGVGAMVLLAVLVTNGGSLRMSPSPSPGTDGSAAAAATAHPEATSDLSRFTDPGEFPNAAEADLLDHLLARVADRCERADPADTPILRFSPDEGQPRTTEPLRTRAGVDCLVDGVRVHYWQAAGSGGYQAHLGFASDLLLNTARRLSIGEGDCADASRVYGPWEAAGHDGLVLCYVGTDGAAMHWSFDDANIYATATRRDGDTAKLYQWWREIGRLLTA